MKGAGTTPSPKNDPENLSNNLIPYSLTSHIHEREISHHLNTPVYFMPHVSSFFQGISLTVTLPLKHDCGIQDFEAHYRSFYQSNPLVKVVKEITPVKSISGKHGVVISGITKHPRDNTVVLVCALDNLLKGAATQALQVLCF